MVRVLARSPRIRGKMGKYHPAYHCSRNGHYFRVTKAAFEQTIEDVVKRLQINQEQPDTLLDVIEQKWNEKQTQVVEDDKKLDERRAELETQYQPLLIV